MAQEKEPFGMIDRFTSSAMDQVSRRGFLKGAGAIGLALLGTFFGIGSQKAEAIVKCPPTTFGDCSSCYSSCNYATQGTTFKCVCASCNCTPPMVEAMCQWVFKPPLSCIKNGVCLEC